MSPLRIFLPLILLSSSLLLSCSSATPQTPPQVVTVYSSSFTSPWLTELYACAGASVVIQLSDSPGTADIRLQLGEPAFLSSFAFQIDEEEILVVTHRQSPIQNLNLEEAQALFMGLGDPSVQVWVYDSEAEMQKAFDQFVMEGRSVTSSAWVAVNPQQMSDTLVNESNAVGILSRHWMREGVREIYSVTNAPVLAITKNEPQGVIKNLLSCMQ